MPKAELLPSFYRLPQIDSFLVLRFLINSTITQNTFLRMQASY